MDEFEQYTPRPGETTIFPLPRPDRSFPFFRGIDSETFSRYRVAVNTDPDKSDIEAIFPRFNLDNQHISNQVRRFDKQFKCEGDTKGSGVFGRHIFPAGGKTITITEGYYDTLSAFQMQGSKYPTVGVMSASTAKKEIVYDFEYLNSFDSIIINFDNDEPGKEAAKEVAGLFEPGKVRILTLTKKKDANDYLQSDLTSDYKNEWWRAPAFMPDGIVMGGDLWDDIENQEAPFSVPYPWYGLNHKLYGIRLSEVVLLLADTGSGKTTVMKALEHSLLMNKELQELGWGVGILHLEEPKRDTAVGLMSIEAGKAFHLPDTIKTTEELRDAYDKVVNTNRFVLWDHFGSNDIDVVLSKIRHMAALGCKYVMVDHLSIIVSDQHGDERKQLDEISTKIKTLCMNLNVAVICVMHINRQGQARGSAGPEQVANIVIRLTRDKKDRDEWRRNVTEFEVEKNRFCGRTGPAGYVWYEEETTRLIELDPASAMRFEEGGSNVGNEFQNYDNLKKA